MSYTFTIKFEINSSIVAVEPNKFIAKISSKPGDPFSFRMASRMSL